MLGNRFLSDRVRNWICINSDNREWWLGKVSDPASCRTHQQIICLTETQLSAHTRNQIWSCSIVPSDLWLRNSQVHAQVTQHKSFTRWWGAQNNICSVSEWTYGHFTECNSDNMATCALCWYPWWQHCLQLSRNIRDKHLKQQWAITKEIFPSSRSTWGKLWCQFTALVKLSAGGHSAHHSNVDCSYLL